MDHEGTAQAVEKAKIVVVDDGPLHLKNSGGGKISSGESSDGKSSSAKSSLIGEIMDDDDDDEKMPKGLEEEKAKAVFESAVVHNEESEYSSDSDTMPEVVGVHSLDEFTEEKRQIYLKWAKKREGFAIPRFPKVSFGMLIPATQEELTTDTLLLHFANCAIEDNNRDKEKKLKLVRIIKCNCRLVGYAAYYITLEAKDEDTGNNDIYEVEVQVTSY